MTEIGAAGTPSSLLVPWRRPRDEDNLTVRLALIEVVQQHGHGRDVFLALRQRTGKELNPLHPLRLKLVAVAQVVGELLPQPKDRFLVEVPFSAQGRADRLLEMLVQQQRDEGGVLFVGDQTPCHRQELLHSRVLLFVARSEPRFQQRSDSFAYRLRHVLIAGKGALLEVHPVLRADPPQQQPLQHRHQRDGLARAPRPAGAAGAVDVHLGLVRRLVLDDVREIRQVDSAGGHVGGHEEAELALPDPAEHFLPGGLPQVGGQLVGVVPEPLQHRGDVADPGAGVAEDQRRVGVLDLDDPDQAPVLLHVGHGVVHVFHFGDVHVIAAQAEELRVVQELAGKALHPRRECRREHVAVDSALGQVPLQLLHVRVEPDRQHAVGFVEDEDLEVLQRQVPVQQVVEDAPGRPDHDVGALFEGLHLMPVADPAVDGHRAHA